MRSLNRGPLPWSLTILDSGGVHDFFLVATGGLVRKTYGILKKRAMSEGFILSQVLLTAFLQSCLILEHARDQKKIKGILLVLVCFMHRRLG